MWAASVKKVPLRRLTLQHTHASSKHLWMFIDPVKGTVYNILHLAYVVGGENVGKEIF
jgi:hypothetical protein